MLDLPRARTIIEPFRIKSVEPIRFLTASERARVVQAPVLRHFTARFTPLENAAARTGTSPRK
jgi:hypothetical protein